jgi:hypothetical protein
VERHTSNLARDDSGQVNSSYRVADVVQLALANFTDLLLSRRRRLSVGNLNSNSAAVAFREEAAFSRALDEIPTQRDGNGWIVVFHS